MHSVVLGQGRRIVLAGTLLAFGTPAFAQQPDGLVAGLGEDYFAAGASVALAEPVGGDALLAGGRIESNASIGGDATLAGGQVAVRATVGDDLYVAGGQVEVDALVAGNARIAGGRVRIFPESRIAGGAAIAGASLSLDGRYGGYLTVIGDDVTIGGDIAGDVRVWAQDLRLRGGTRIGGALIYRGEEPPQIPPDVLIAGGVIRAGDETRGVDGGWRGFDAGEGAGMVGWFWLAGLVAVGLFLALGLARFSERTTHVLTGRPWLGIGLGFIALACIPALILALFITLVGIPLAIIMLLLYLAMLIGAYVIGALYLGDRALAKARPGVTISPAWRIAAFLAVIVALALVGQIPVFGGIVRIAVLLLGLGGIVLVAWGAPRGPRPASNAPVSHGS